MRKYLLFLFLASAFMASAQTDVYVNLIKQAETQYYAKQYKASSETFLKAFSFNGNKSTANDRYNAACSMAQAGLTNDAFVQLEWIANKSKYTDYNHLVIDPDLNVLHSDKRWSAVCKIIKNNKDRSETGMNKPVVAILDAVLKDDQEDRMKIEAIVSTKGANSKECQKLAAAINKKDSINVLKVTKILDKYGWLGKDVIGEQGNSTLFLVIQHADLKTQEKYFPMMQQAVRNHKAKAGNLALLEDRIALRRGKKQIYGSQVASSLDGQMFVSPLSDPDHVDERRASVGLGPLADYLRSYNIKWDPAAYKKQLPEIERMQKEVSQ